MQCLIYSNHITTQDELLWAAAWLHRATGDKEYLDYLGNSGDTGGSRTEFSWNDKYVGAQVLIARVYHILCASLVS